MLIIGFSIFLDRLTARTGPPTLVRYVLLPSDLKAREFGAVVPDASICSAFDDYY